MSNHAGPKRSAAKRRAGPFPRAASTPLAESIPRARSTARSSPSLRARIWIETQGVALNDAGADLLEQIHAAGSLSEAARRLHFSYRRAWMLLDGMNHRWPSALVTTAIGGKRGGGAKLTELGHAVLSAYRDVQVQVETTLDHATSGFRRATKMP